MIRRTTILALVVAMLLVPATALAFDDAADTDRPAPTDAERDATTDHRRGFEAAKERVLDAIDVRLRALGTLSTKIENNRFITEQHAGMLRGDIQPATAHLEQLSRKIEDAETWEELLALIPQIDDDKVFAILVPKTHQVIASDALVVGADKLAAFGEKLDTAITRFEEAGYDVAEAWRLLDEMVNQVAEGLRLADPVAESVIGLDPEDWPEPGQTLLAQGRSDLVDARQSLRAARGAAVDIVQFLRNLYDPQTDV